MKLSNKLAEAFNKQINAEMWSSNLYLSMALYFQKEGLDGFAHWMKKQADEEMEHAHKLIDYAIDRGADATIGQIDAVPVKWENAVAVFENTYEHECKVSAMIDEMMTIAEADKDYASRELLSWFVSEQVEEESTAQKILDQLKRYGDCHIAILDNELGKR